MKMAENNIKKEVFMVVFMCELELYLQSHIDDFEEISFQSDEANTDRPLKEYLKNVIENKCKRIEEFSRIKTVQLLQNIKRQYEITDDIKNIFVNRVLLPDEITEEIKAILKRKKVANFTNPDLCLELNINGELVYETIELKSTKDDSIPGSSVQQISPYEWVIFIKHNKSGLDITTGRYIYAVNSRLQFPDRSPRPQVSFKELKNWNTKNREIGDDSIQYKATKDKEINKKLLTDWQAVLAERWVEVVFSKDKVKKEPWFNNNLRKFVLLFIDKYEKMDEAEKESYIETLKNLIE